MIPDYIDSLDPPPLNFDPCDIPEYFGPNFSDHVDFSKKRNKFYWVLFLTSSQDKPGSLELMRNRATCMAAKGRLLDASEVVAFVQTWEEVVAVWAKHCYHRHGKCSRHPDRCVSGDCASGECRAHPPQALIVVKREAKIEPTNVSLKRTSSASAVKPSTPMRSSRRGPPPSYSPVPETEVGSESRGKTLPLYADDTPSPIRSPSCDPDAVAEQHSLTPSPTPPPSTISSPPLSEESSLSASTAGPSTAAPSAPADKGKGRAGSSSVARRVSRHDPFYVGANGSIHHSSTQAFADVGAGRIQVVIGWEAAARYARRVVAGGAGLLDSVSTGGAGMMEVDDD
ncbi:hypothetical protein C8R47DRAFT_1070281 [Mycena vitilis]|nr:hypothetical protein C8R47DRAFT_1070281 [Mycena vitilis]